MNSVERAIEALLRSIAILLVAMALGCSAPQVPGKEATFPGIEGAEVLAVVGSREITSELDVERIATHILSDVPRRPQVGVVLGDSS
ncbi:MAG TPA: hypothetical protein EYN79_05720 [Planctomycetes bacterium]|nr:hypothetical protein [Planctomycetota bacterium]